MHLNSLWFEDGNRTQKSFLTDFYFHIENSMFWLLLKMQSLTDRDSDALSPICPDTQRTS